MVKRVMILAGGTGGHVYPALAVARELLEAGHEVVWMGTRKGLEAKVVPAAGIPIEWLSVSGIRGKGWQGLLKAPFMLVRAFLQSLAIVWRVRPQVALGMGGFVSGPGGLVARCLGVPLILHEQNRIPGTTNRWLALWATVVLEAFPGSFPARVGAIACGNPLRREIASLAGKTRDRIWNPSLPLRVLVVGGSLGAKGLNEVVPAALARVGVPMEVRHQTGEAMRVETRDRYDRLGLKAEVTAFLEDMADAYAWAHVAICRSGAMTVSELAAAGLPAVLVPYSHAIDDHQTANALFLVESGASELLPQSRLTAESLASIIQGWLDSPDKLAEMGKCAHGLAAPEAASLVANLCLGKARIQTREQRHEND